MHIMHSGEQTLRDQIKSFFNHYYNLFLLNNFCADWSCYNVVFDRLEEKNKIHFKCGVYGFVCRYCGASFESGAGS